MLQTGCHIFNKQRAKHVMTVFQKDRHTITRCQAYDQQDVRYIEYGVHIYDKQDVRYIEYGVPYIYDKNYVRYIEYEVP